MKTNCSDGLGPPSGIFIRRLEPVYIGLGATCGVLTLGVTLLFLEQMYFLYIHLDKWKSRFHVTCLLSLYPVYCLLSMVSLFVPRSMPLNDLVSGIYISICLYVFVRLLIGHYGGKECMMSKLVGEDMALAAPPVCCCCCCLPVIKISRSTVHTLEGSVLQYGIFRTIGGYFSAVVYADQQSSLDINTVFSRGILMVLSTMLAMYGLQLLYRVSVNPLSHIPLNAKFRCLQMVLIIDNVQRSILVALGSAGYIPCDSGLSSELNSYRIHRMITILEMLLLSVIARRFYRSHMEDIRRILTSDGLFRQDSTASCAQIIGRETTEISMSNSTPDLTFCADSAEQNTENQEERQAMDQAQMQPGSNVDTLQNTVQNYGPTEDSKGQVAIERENDDK